MRTIFSILFFSLMASIYAHDGGFAWDNEPADGGNKVPLEQALAETTTVDGFIRIASSCPEATRAQTVYENFDKFLSLKPTIADVKKLVDIDLFTHPKFQALFFFAAPFDDLKDLDESQRFIAALGDIGRSVLNIDLELLVRLFQHRIKNGLQVMVTAEDLGVLQVRLGGRGFEIWSEWLPNAFPETKPGIRTSGYQITEIRQRPSFWAQINPINWFKKNGKGESGSGSVGVGSKGGGRVGRGRASELEISMSTVRADPEGTVADEPLQPGSEWDSIEDKLGNIERGVRVNSDGTVAWDTESPMDSLIKNFGEVADSIVKALHLNNATGETMRDERVREGRRFRDFGIRGRK